METISIVNAIVFALYTLLTFGWLFHVIKNKAEATTAHWLMTLYPFFCWLIYLIGMSVNSPVTASLDWKYLLPVIVGYVTSAVIFLILALLASGYCLLPEGLVQGRTVSILVLTAAGFFMQLVGAFVQAWFLQLLQAAIFIVQLVMLVKWSQQTVVLASQNPNANLLVGTWGISYPHRVQVSNGTKKVVLVYICALIVMFILGIVFFFMVLSWIVNDSDNANISSLNGNFTDWTIALIIVGGLFQAVVFLMLASMWRLGAAQSYALLPQYGQPSAPTYGTVVGGDYAPVHNGVYTAPAPTAIGYAPSPTAVNYAPAPTAVAYASAPQY